MAEYYRPSGGNKKIKRSDSVVRNLTKDYGGEVGQEGALLNGLLALGYDPAFVQSLADADPNRRFLDDAVTRALRGGVLESDVKRALQATRLAATGDPQGAIKALGVRREDLPPSSAAIFDAIANRQPLPFLDRGQVAPTAVPAAAPTGDREGYRPTAPRPTEPAQPSPGQPPPSGVIPSPAGSAAKKAGAAGAPGGLGGKTVVPDLSQIPKPMSFDDAAKIINDRYGYMGSLLQNPDINKIMHGLVDGTIAPDQFQNRLMATDWYRNQSDAQQAWVVLEATHPEEAKAKVTETAGNVKSFAVAMGFTIDDATANEITTSALKGGWDQTQLRSSIGSHYSFTTGTSAVSGIAEEVKKKAADFLVPLSDQTITQWGQQIISGTSTIQDFNDYARNAAKAQYPGLSAWLDQDPERTVKQFVDPYAEQAARVLEIPADSIDFTSPKYAALFGKLDPKTGDRSIMTGPEWNSYLKQQEEWQYTNNAHDTIANLTDTLAKTFGMVG